MSERAPFGAWLRELGRPAEGRLLAGVCAGFAYRLEIDVTLLRLAFLVLALASGLGILLYVLLWLLLPGSEPMGNTFRGVVWGNVLGMRYELQEFVRRASTMWSHRGENSRWPRPLSRRWIAVGLMTGGAFVLLYSLGIFSWLGTVRSLGLAAIAVGASVLITLTPELRR